MTARYAGELYREAARDVLLMGEGSATETRAWLSERIDDFIAQAAERGLTFFGPPCVKRLEPLSEGYPFARFELSAHCWRTTAAAK